MGIKFHCPNGHKLNVKSFLGGKRAFCPKCGVGLIVPTLEESLAGGGTSATDGAESTADAPLDVLATPAEPGAAQGTFQTQVTTAPVDVIAEAPGAVWYMRAATGGQFGPASGDIMRSWLNEGRVGADSLVWRAGWPEWRAAADVFPQLSTAVATPGQVASPAQPASSVPSGSSSASGPPPIGSSPAASQMLQSIPADQSLAGPAGVSPSVPPLARSVRRRRRQNDRRLYVSAVLVVVSIILFIVLFVVFQRQGQQAEPTTQEASPAAEDLLE